MIKASHILPINLKKEVLLQLRDNKPGIWFPGCWGFLGGEIREKEIPLEGLIRELKEEIPNCNIKNINFLNILEFLDNCLFIFKGEIEEPEEEINRKLTEGQKVKFFKFNEIKNLKIPSCLKNFIYKNKHRIFA